MRPGTAKRPAGLAISPLSFGSAFRSPAHAISPPSTTIAAITTLNTAPTPQEHGNIAYFVWLEESAAVTQLLRWGPGVTRRGSFFDNQTIDPRDYVKVPSVHRRLRERGAMSYVVEPE